ncbi:MAG TPA: sigma-70 family RNA polymerase sigma factor [Candidatus Saccharimonadales bacterium]|nr:sigma-70 family RNA polymerase sigma factor [Candidatus Saccharimonadales bacterium]
MSERVYNLTPDDAGELPEAPQPQEVLTDTDLVRVYLKQIGRTALLTAEQEVDLAKRIEAGLYASEVLARVPAQSTGNEGATDVTDTDNVPMPNEDVIEVDDDSPLERLLRAKAVEVTEDTKLLKEYKLLARDGQAAKNHLLEANLRLVVSIAKRYTGHGLKFLDIIQEGNIGLVRATEKFDYQKGFKFSTYATWWIRQNITRAMADSGRTIRLPVHLQEKINHIDRVERELEMKSGAKPTVEELAAELDVTAERIEELKKYGQDVIWYDQEVGNMNTGGMHDASHLLDFIEDTNAPVGDAAVELIMMHENIRGMLNELSEREQDVVRYRFGLVEDGKCHTLEEIAKMHGVTRERIRQIEKKSVDRLKKVAEERGMRDFL